MLYSVEIGKNVLILRGGRGLSQEELADRAGISVSRLRDIEHGYANASIDVLESVAVALDTELPTLFLLSLEEEQVLDMLRRGKAVMEVVPWGGGMEMVLTEIYDLLYRLGITANYTGFFHMGYAVKLCCERPERLLMVTKWVYPEVAKHYQTNGRAVERNIRTVGKVLWEQNRPALEQLAGRPLSDKPGNAQLLAMLSHCLLVQPASEAACSVEGRR